MALPENGKFLAKTGLAHLIELIQASIGSEATTRANADNALSSRITTLENTKVVKPVNGTSDYKIQITSSAPASGTSTDIITFVI